MRLRPRRSASRPKISAPSTAPPMYAEGDDHAPVPGGPGQGVEARRDRAANCGGGGHFRYSFRPMETKIVTRWQASGLHLAISAAIAALAVALVALIWYPGPLAEAAGGYGLLFL